MTINLKRKPVLKEVKEYSMAMKIVSHNRRAVVIMREEIEKFCKKLRLRPGGNIIVFQVCQT